MMAIRCWWRSSAAALAAGALVCAAAGPARAEGFWGDGVDLLGAQPSYDLVRATPASGPSAFGEDSYASSPRYEAVRRSQRRDCWFVDFRVEQSVADPCSGAWRTRTVNRTLPVHSQQEARLIAAFMAEQVRSRPDRASPAGGRCPVGRAMLTTKSSY